MKRRPYIIIGIILSVFAIILAGLFIYNSVISARFNKQLDLGNHYLAEKNYQEAISAFKKAMEIKPKRPEPYVNLAKIYVSLDDPEEAVRILTAGMQHSEDGSIADLLYEIKSGILATSTENTENNTTAHVVQFKDEVFERIVLNRFGAGAQKIKIYNTSLLDIEFIMIVGDERPEGISSTLYEDNTSNNLMMQIMSINGYGKLRTLDDFKYFLNLNSLMISKQDISDISPLEGLTKLELLSLDSFQISDISPLKNLTNLTWLNLSDNYIADISPLKSLSELTSLQLDENRISDIHGLESLVKLTELHLSDNQIADISPLKGLTKLTYLDLSYNSITDISALKDLTNLRYLNLYGNPLTYEQLQELRKALPGCEINL